MNGFSSHFFNRLIKLLAAGFVILSAAHYLSQRPLWNDEEAILVNLKTFEGAELFTTLLNVQAFPRVHLILVQWIAQPFDYHVLALRLLSFVFMLGAFFVWLKIYQRTFSEKYQTLLAAAAFAGSYRLIYYAAELKPYSCDVLAVGLITFFCIGLGGRDQHASRVSLFASAMLLPLLVFFSYAAIFAIALLSINLFFLALKDRRFWSIFILNAAVTIVSAAVLYQIDLKHSVTVQALRDYWAGSFICTDNARCFMSTLGEGIKKLVIYWQGSNKAIVSGAVIFIPFFFIGMWQKGIKPWLQGGPSLRTAGTAGTFLFLELMIAGLLKQYPFSGSRLTLYFAPFVFYFVIEGISLLKGPAWVRRAAGGYFFGYALFCFLNSGAIIVQTLLS